MSTPKNGEGLPVKWIEVEAPDGYRLMAAVWRPNGTGPFPVIVLFHPTAGFSPSVILIGQDFAAAGFLTVAGEWFTGAGPAGPGATRIIENPRAPPFSGANLNSIKYADAIVKAARTLPGANSKRVGLMGWSRGAQVSLLLASAGAGVQAVVADSGGYTMETRYDLPAISVVQNLLAPLLVLHGTADQTINVQEARDYEEALRKWNKLYEVKYYEGAGHGVSVLKSRPNYADAIERAIAFFRKHLIPQG